GLEPAAVIVEIMNEDGTMARRPDLEKFAEQHNLKIGTIADLIHYRMVNEQTVKRVQENILPTEYGDFRLISYQEHAGSDVHIALIKGDVQRDTPVVRVHAVNPLRDLLHAKYQGRTGWNLQKSLAEIAKHDAGILVLLGQDYQSADMVDHVKQFFDGRPRANDGAGMYRTIGVGSQILRDLGVSKMRLLSSPMRFNALSGFGLEIVEYLATE
ncbi:MAG TPA: 3,4-dihydroxy-2-butanone-4-phosphate synthase, partial [Agitococcus sp.]|nr:3,4-dihydroxy-2-butanone-4-phosphate synthase [Agitococcus sp.]